MTNFIKRARWIASESISVEFRALRPEYTWMRKCDKQWQTIVWSLKPGRSSCHVSWTGGSFFFRSSKVVFSCLEIWLDWFDWLIDWLIDWLLACLLAWLVGWLVGWLVDWLIGWLIDWLIDWLVDWLIVYYETSQHCSSILQQNANANMIKIAKLCASSSSACITSCCRAA